MSTDDHNWKSTQIQKTNNTDFDELTLSEGIQVWGAAQETLEEQALKELKVLTQESYNGELGNQNEDLEEGEIAEKESPSKSVKGSATLNLESYIKSQEDLKKRQLFKKSLACTEARAEIAKRKLKKAKRSPNKRKKNECEGTINRCVNIENNLEVNEVESLKDDDNSGSEYLPSEGELDSDYEPGYDPRQTSNLTAKLFKASRKYRNSNTEMKKLQDDGLLSCYKSRLNLYYKTLEAERLLQQNMQCEDEVLKGGLKIPSKTWNKLYDYQQHGVKWLWKLHQKATGGILGDEMGLGKTVQIIAFLLSLEHSRIISCHGRFNGLGPSLVICPATVIHQWVMHFHEWAPEFRVAVLHQSGNFQGDKVDLIKELHKSKGIIVTTFIGILKYNRNLLEYNWHYLILDEGHKIRNPTAKVTIAVKKIRTPHKILLTGSPMQNNLTELWSLFDFTNPGVLGNISTFQEHFSTPILQGGFANSTPMQEATALSVATTLKDLITPYLLRRSKVEVQEHIMLPNKSEQVLFCSLSDEQKKLYKEYLLGDHISSILGKNSKHWFSDNHVRANVLVGITTLRKICNHPDIHLHETNLQDDDPSPDDSFGYYKKSGKMIVVSALLKIWKKQGHRILLFTQSRSMIAIFVNFLQQQGYKYLKMDGLTSISSRQPIIDKFNKDESYDVFLSTTRVGGLGVNLTGANRVIIYDPDWNPATDTQARERAWRIGQDKEVTIYRLLSAGTIEEKMYQRQVWKQLLSNKVLLDPKTNRFFKSSDLHDLFSLQESDANPETANIFHDSRVRIQENIRKKKDKKRKHSTNSDNTSGQFTEEKIQAMKNLAAQISKSLSQKKTGIQLDVEEERQKRLAEKKQLKQLTPEALLHYNQDKAKITEDTSINKIDDHEANVGFVEALKYSEKTAKLHHALVSGTIKEPHKIAKTIETIRKKVIKENNENPLEKYLKESEKKHLKEKKKKNRDRRVDCSGTIDGEHVDGLVKAESKKKRKEKNQHSYESQDDFVLGKLFQTKGVSGALQHESIVQSRTEGSSLRIHTEARMRAEKSLEALRKSRVDNWRW